MDVEKHAAAIQAAGTAYLRELRAAAEASQLPMLTKMADEFERQHIQWVPKRLASLAPVAAADAPAEG